MPRLAWMRWMLLPLAAATAGCQDLASATMKGQLVQSQQQQLTLSRQAQELQNRANALDRDNQDKDIKVAQARQQAQAAEEQLVAVKEQLASVTRQLAQARQEQQSSESKVQALNGLRRYGKSLTRHLHDLGLLGLQSRHRIDHLLEPRHADVLRSKTGTGDPLEHCCGFIAENAKL